MSDSLENTVSRLLRNPREVAQELFDVFADGVEAQLTGGTVTPQERGMIVSVLESETALDKRDELAEVIDTCRESARAMRDRVKLIEANARHLEAVANRISHGLLVYMAEKGISRIAGAWRTFVRYKNPAKLEINPHLLPDEFKRTEVSIVPDKEKIEAALAEGKTVPGAQYVQGERLAVK